MGYIGDIAFRIPMQLFDKYDYRLANFEVRAINYIHEILQPQPWKQYMAINSIYSLRA